MGIIVTPEAVRAALTAWHTSAHPASKDAMRVAIEAALPHLDDAGLPLTEPARDGLDAQYFTDRFDALQRLLKDRLDAAERQPTDYEVWRDALLIAATALHELPGSPADQADEVAYLARNFVGTLRRAGARDDTDPVDDFAPDDVISFTEAED